MKRGPSDRAARNIKVTGSRHAPAKPGRHGKPEKPIRTAPPRYILFHKPYGVLSQFTPEGGKACLRDFINVPGVYACGRLDWDSEGLLLLTNDGDFNQRIAEPRAKLPKTYWVQVEGIPDEAALQALRAGVVIEGKPTLPAYADRFPAGERLPPRDPPIRVRKLIPTAWLRLTIVEGRNRQVRKMTAAVGYPTLRLIRQRIGPFDLDGLAPGGWRELASAEIAAKMSTFSRRPRT